MSEEIKNEPIQRNFYSSYKALELTTIYVEKLAKLEDGKIVEYFFCDSKLINPETYIEKFQSKSVIKDLKFLGKGTIYKINGILINKSRS